MDKSILSSGDDKIWFLSQPSHLSDKKDTAQQ